MVKMNRFAEMCCCKSAIVCYSDTPLLQLLLYRRKIEMAWQSFKAVFFLAKLARFVRTVNFEITFFLRSFLYFKDKFELQKTKSKQL